MKNRSDFAHCNLLANEDGRSQAGFTLVELAIVLIIIGLLIGGILKGQELVDNARIKGTLSQIESIGAATYTFQDKYRDYPGDMVGAGARIPGCVGSCAPGAANGNGRIDAVPGGAAVAESIAFWDQLAAADLLSGYQMGSAQFPARQTGAFFLLGYSTGAAADFPASESAVNIRAGHYLIIKANPVGAAVTPASVALTPSEAARIDRKLDDGRPWQGSIRAFEGAGGCDDGGTLNIYDETISDVRCGLYIRMN